MIGPVSGTGRAMMASLQQAMSKGMPPDQAIQYVKSMATQGVAPMADLYAMMNQFQRLKQQPVQAPQTPPTIRDQLNMAEQQLAQQQMAMQQGLGGMPAPVMEQAQFAGGGIVAFAEGGATKDIDFSKMTAEQLDMLSETDDRSVAQAAVRERLRRSGYRSVSDLWKEGSRMRGELMESSFPVVKYDDRPFPAHMYDESGQVKKTERPTAGIAGLTDRRPVTAVSTETRPRLGGEASSPAASPDAVTPFSMSAFRREPENILEAARDVDLAGERSTAQGLGAIDPRRKTTSRGSVQTAKSDPFTDALKRVEGLKFDQAPDTYSAKEEERIKKDMASLGEERQQARRMAMAQAGFGMAAAASRRGRDRTSFLGALSEGAMGGMKQYNEAQRELRGIERELNKQMSSLAQYRDQVAANNIKGNREFEISKINAINELSTEKYKLEQQAILERAKIAAMQERGSAKPEDILDVLRREYAMQVRNNDPQAAATKKLLDELVETTTGVATAMKYAARSSGTPGIPGMPGMDFASAANQELIRRGYTE